MAALSARQQAIIDGACSSSSSSSISSAFGVNNTMAPIHLATSNIRYDGQSQHPVPIPSSGAITPNSSIGEWFEHPWCERRSRLVDALLASGSLDVIGFQEVLHSQLEDLSALLGPAFSHVGVGRDDGKQAGEYSPIFYDNTRWQAVDWSTKWLSLTPDVPGSKSWDAASLSDIFSIPHTLYMSNFPKADPQAQTRIVTLLTLQDRSSSELLHIGNTHYDDQGVQSRAEASKLIRTIMYDWEHKMTKEAGKDGNDGSVEKAPVVLLGDFNSPPNEDGYKTAISSSPLSQPSLYFLDSYTSLSSRSSASRSAAIRQSTPYGPVETYTTFGPPGSSGTGRIDFVFLAAGKASDIPAQAASGDAGKGSGTGAIGQGGWSATRYMVLENHVEGGDSTGFKGRWSDHRPVRVTIERIG